MDALFIISAGLFGTTSMIIALKAFQYLGWRHPDMEEAIGSIVTKEAKKSYYPGVFIHYGLGIVFAFIYAGLLALMPMQFFGPIVLPSTIFGIGHGIVASLLLSMIVMQYNPLKKFRDAGAEVALSHCFAHIAYGATVGVFLSFTQVRNRNEIQGVLMGIPLVDGMSFLTGLIVIYGAFLIPLFALLHKKFKKAAPH